MGERIGHYERLLGIHPGPALEGAGEAMSKARKGPQGPAQGPRERRPLEEAQEPALEPRQPSRVISWPFPYTIRKGTLIRNVLPRQSRGKP